MIELLKKYWDIISGVGSGLFLAVIAKFKLESVQLYSSIIILILVGIGVFRTLKQAIDKYREKKAAERKHTLIDSMVDGQKSIKAISLAQSPTSEGEKIGKLIIKLCEVFKRNMNKLKTFFDKFKGYMLTIALAVLTVVEMYGGYINDLLGDALTVGGIELIPLITFVCAIVVGIVSNGFTKEQLQQIKALFSKSTTNELIKKKIKNQLETNTEKLKQSNKTLATKQHELANLESELTKLNNNLEANIGMFEMTPQLATEEDVQVAQNAVKECETKISAKQAEIDETKVMIDNLSTTIAALKSQL